MKRFGIIILLFASVYINAQVITVTNPYDGVDLSKSYKSGLHNHTTESDGYSDPDVVIDHFSDSDYDIFAITDHDYSALWTTWPWTDYITETPSLITSSDTMQTSAYYPDLNNGNGMLAVRGSELSHHDHVVNLFTNLTYASSPSGGEDTYFHDIDSLNGLGWFAHPKRYDQTISWYNDYFDDYYGTILGVEVYSTGDLYYAAGLWDSINAERSYDSLIWGFSVDDMHSIGNSFWSYHEHFLDTLTESALRSNLVNGAFTFSFEEDQSGDALSPKLTGVSVSGSEITITASNCDSVHWVDKTGYIISDSYTIDISSHSTHYVRAVLINDEGVTLTQPFGYSLINPYGGDYFVDPNGNDSYSGTSYDSAWATPQKAFETADAGDTVWFMGGSYLPTDYAYAHDIYNYDITAGRGNCGTESNRIYYINYPNENPIFDFSNIGASTYNIGIKMDSLHYVTFKGLTFQNLPKASPGPTAMNIEAFSCSNLHFEQIVCRNSGGAGIRYFSAIGESTGIETDTVRVINCDFFNNVDSVGNYADGLKYDQDPGAYILIEGCRSMFNSDDGFDCSGSAMRIFKNNWSIGNGWFGNGDGNGFKSAYIRDTIPFAPIIFINNLAAYNHSTGDNAYGFDIGDMYSSDTSYRRANARLYNNTAYMNDIGFAEFTNVLWDFRNCVYRNNISYKSRHELDGYDINVQIINYEYPESHNTWDFNNGGYWFVETDTVALTDDDFVLTDSTLAIAELQADRGDNGALPTITFLTLDEGSDLIDAGTTNGWSEFEGYPGIEAQSYSGEAPDIGYFEFSVSQTIVPTGHLILLKHEGQWLKIP